MHLDASSIHRRVHHPLWGWTHDATLSAVGGCMMGMDPWVLTDADSPQPYHIKAMRLWQQLEREGMVTRQQVYHSRVEHDDGCVIFTGQPRCSCDPEVSFIPHEEPDCAYCRKHGRFPIGVEP